MEFSHFNVVEGKENYKSEKIRFISESDIRKKL